MWFDEDASESDLDEQPLSPLHWAVHEGDAEGVGRELAAVRERGGEAAVRELLERRTPPKTETAYTSPDPEHTAFTWACSQGHADCVEVLVRAGCDRAAETPSGETGAELARRRSAKFEGCLDVLRRLSKLDAERRAAERQAAAEKPAGKKNWKALGKGVKLSGFVREAEFRAGGRLKNLDKEEAEIARLKETALVESLGEYSARPELSTTMLVIAAELGDVEAARARLETGASVEAAREDKITPLYCACYMAAKHHADRRESRRFLKVVKVLLEAGADVNCVGPGGMTPLVCAAKYGALRLCKRLRVAGADPLTPTKQGRITAMAAAMVMGHDEVKEYFLGPRTYFEAREKQLSHAAMEAKLGGMAWVADTLESMSERERIAKEVALEAEQRALQADMEEAEDNAQTQAEADAEAAEEAQAKAKRKVWRDRFKRALARKRQEEWEQAQREVKPAQHLLRQAFLGYEAAVEERGRGGVGGLPLDNLVGVRRMELDELLDRARDLAFLKDHPAWDAAVQEVPPPARTKRERRRKKIREELAAWCRDWRLASQAEEQEEEAQLRAVRAASSGQQRPQEQATAVDPVAFGRGGPRFHKRGGGGLKPQRSPRTRPRSACNEPIPHTAGTGADAARAAKALRVAQQQKELEEAESMTVYQAWVDGGCKVGVAVPVLVGEMGPWAASAASTTSSSAASSRRTTAAAAAAALSAPATRRRRRRTGTVDVPSCSEWRRARQMPICLLAAQLNDRGQQLQMALDAIVERCWEDTKTHQSAREALGKAGGVVGCIRLLESTPPLGEQPTLYLRCLTLLVMLSKDSGEHRKVLMEQGGIAVFLSAFRDGESGGETQCLGLLGLCNLAMETVGQRWIMQKEGIINELSAVALNGVGGQFCLRPGLQVEIRYGAGAGAGAGGSDSDDDTTSAAVGADADADAEAVAPGDGTTRPIRSQEEGVALLQSTAKSSARLLLSLVGLPEGMIPEPGVGRGNIEILSQRRARWERQTREDPTGEKAAAKKRAEIAEFQQSFFAKEELGSAKLTEAMVRHGILSIWKSESKVQKAARAKEDAEAAEAATIAVAQHGDRNAPSICYPKREPPEDCQTLLQFVRSNPLAWRTWVQTARPSLSSGKSYGGSDGSSGGSSKGAEPLRYDPQVWREFWRHHHEQSDLTDEWQHKVVMRLERKNTKVAQKHWKVAGRKLQLGAALGA
jgi:ankyrin repeat protein